MKKLILMTLVVLIATTVNALESKTITVNGSTREYLQYVPQGIEEGQPLLISCHGSGQGPDFQANYMKIENVCDTARFITVFPKGKNLQWDITGNSDIDFILALIDKMHEE